jgi:hypothetical protein
VSSSAYVYQIKGVLEKPNKEIGGFRVAVCSVDILQTVDVPADIFNPELLSYFKYRLAVNNYLDVRKLPDKIHNQLRAPLNEWLDYWVLYGDSK